MSNCCDRFVMIEGEDDSFETWQGLRGPYYTPSVSEDGTLSWTNNGGLQNPADRNIKGPPGPGGVPGGTTGQLLAKASNEDFDTEWIDQPEMDAGHVSYDSTETYSDGTVGKELGTINSALSSLQSVTEIIDTASGAIASFPDGSGLPMRSLVAQINPVQAGTGDPSPENVRPITGWTGLSGERDGKNLLRVPYTDGASKTGSNVTYTVNSAGQISIACSASASGNFDYYLFGGAGSTYESTGLETGTYTFSVSVPSATTGLQMFAFREDGTSLCGKNVGSGASQTFDIDSTKKYRMFLRVQSGNTVNTVASPQLEVGSTASTYEAYTSLPITCTWQTEAGTVYDGYIDVVSGELVATHKSDSKTDAWSQASNGAFYLDGKATDGDAGTLNAEADVWCNIYPRGVVGGATSAAVDHPKTLCTQDLNGIRFMVYDTSWASVADFNSYVAQNPIQIVYKLATPQTYQLTPQQISTLLGNNTVFVDTGSVSVTYQASIKGYIDKVLGS